MKSDVSALVVLGSSLLYVSLKVVFKFFGLLFLWVLESIGAVSF